MFKPKSKVSKITYENSESDESPPDIAYVKEIS